MPMFNTPPYKIAILFLPPKLTPQQQENKNQFNIKCKCGKNGIVRLKKIKIYKKTKHQQRLQERLKPEFKTKKDFNGNVIKERVNRTEHPYRYEAVMSYLFAPEVLLNSHKKPVINPPKPEPESSKPADAIEDLNDSLVDLDKSFRLFRKILPLVERKYPGIRAILKDNEEELTKYIKMFRELLNSATDDRYKRSLPEWALILKEAIEKSPRAAAKKYSGITPDGKEIRLSAEYIHQKIKKISEGPEFFDIYSYYESIFIMIVSIVMKTVGQDPELLAIYKEYESDYGKPVNEVMFRKITQVKEIVEKEADHFSDEDLAKAYYLTRQLRDIAKQNYEKQQNDYKLYEIFVVRHYDPELRKRQKKERGLGIRKSNVCDGKVEHMMEENDIPPEIVQKLRFKST